MKAILKLKYEGQNKYDVGRSKKPTFP